MTEKENFMKVVRGEVPEWVPRYTFGPNPYATHPPAAMMIMPSCLMGNRTPEGGTDIWGVEFVTTIETGGAALPKPDTFILKDITEWRDIIKAPDISHVDWEKMAANDLKRLGIDRNESALILGTHVGYFQNLMNFMGFTEGLCAMFEEPEEVLALFEYLADFYCEITRLAIDAYKPDILNITDDTATADNPFISPQMYRELVKPFHARQAKLGTDRGIPIEMHDCGRCEDYIEDWRDFGVSIWNPAQRTNDLLGIKKKYGNSLVLAGCWDSSGPAGWPNAPEELVRAAVRETIDLYAPGGGFAFIGSVYGAPDDQGAKDKARWMSEEYEAYRYTPYK